VAIRDKAVFALEHRVRRPDGTLAWTLSRAVPILDDQGEIIEWVGAAAEVPGRTNTDRTGPPKPGWTLMLVGMATGHPEAE
jgi:PAS domain-containing protein